MNSRTEPPRLYRRFFIPILWGNSMAMYISYNGVVTQICNMLIEASLDYDTPRIRLFVQSFVKKVFDYCHRDDFPDTLLYTAIDFAMKNSAREAANFGKILRQYPVPLTVMMILGR